ncbi:MAG: hypothetical protein LLG04_14065, partial [Parachlamydia sp.]|nr:hypothetical protein [Parachlamydia sp.]
VDVLSDWIHGKFPLWRSDASKIRERIKLQEDIVNNEFLPMLEKNFSRWKYSGYLMCARSVDLKRLGGTFKFRPEDLQRVHAIILFYEKLKPQENV